MKTFRIIVLAVLAAIAIEGLAVEAKDMCRQRTDCDGYCKKQFEIRVGGRYETIDLLNKTPGNYGVCEEDVERINKASEQVQKLFRSAFRWQKEKNNREAVNILLAQIQGEV
eukprot:GHVS01101121.1.p1 GENE.GHVS01101121.1~~GHVS01101121.1.p1  ORF type:complete len:112 (+),score=10.10 GHVS01101121.1:94-429(+)